MSDMRIEHGHAQPSAIEAQLADAPRLELSEPWPGIDACRDIFQSHPGIPFRSREAIARDLMPFDKVTFRQIAAQITGKDGKQIFHQPRYLDIRGCTSSRSAAEQSRSAMRKVLLSFMSDPAESRFTLPGPDGFLLDWSSGVVELQEGNERVRSAFTAAARCEEPVSWVMAFCDVLEAGQEKKCRPVHNSRVEDLAASIVAHHGVLYLKSSVSEQARGVYRIENDGLRVRISSDSFDAQYAADQWSNLVDTGTVAGNLSGFVNHLLLSLEYPILEEEIPGIRVGGKKVEFRFPVLATGPLKPNGMERAFEAFQRPVSKVSRREVAANIAVGGEWDDVLPVLMEIFDDAEKGSGPICGPTAYARLLRDSAEFAEQHRDLFRQRFPDHEFCPDRALDLIPVWGDGLEFFILEAQEHYMYDTSDIESAYRLVCLKEGLSKRHDI